MTYAAYRLHTYRGQRVTVRELAAIAGCSYCTMRQRLLRNPDPEACVAMGAIAPTNNQVWSRKRVLYTYQGRQVTCRELSELSGIDIKTMRARLRILPPEQAVARPVRPEKVKAAKTRKPQGNLHHFRGEQLTLRQIAEASGLPLNLLRERTATMSAAEAVARGKPIKGPNSTKPAKPKAAKPPTRNPFATDAEVIIPPGVKRTVWQPPPDPRDAKIGPPPAEFAVRFADLGPGRYLTRDTATQRRFAGSP